MGQPKLILAVDGVPLITRCILALSQGGAGPIVVVTGPRDLPGVDQLVQEAEQAGAHVLTLSTETPDMRATVEQGLDFLAQVSIPGSFLVAPADCPRLSANIVQKLISAAREAPSSLVVPTYQGKRGHPVLFPWRVVADIKALATNQGLNAIVNTDPNLIELGVTDEGILHDIDTPLDYERLTGSSLTNLFGDGSRPLSQRAEDR